MVPRSSSNSEQHKIKASLAGLNWREVETIVIKDCACGSWTYRQCWLEPPMSHEMVPSRSKPLLGVLELADRASPSL